MNRSKLKKELRRAVLQTTPDILPRIMENPPSREQVMGGRETRAPAQRWQSRTLRPALAFAAVAVFCFGMFWSVRPQVESVVSLDVNPSIQMTVDRDDRVMECQARNDDAQKILEGLDLKHDTVDEATDQLIDAMVRDGYLEANSGDNAILVSVATQNQENADRLQQTISYSIKTVLDKNNATAKVIQQKETQVSSDLEAFAKEHSVSVGKADLVQKLTKQDSTLDPGELTQMSLKDLSSLMDEKDLTVDNVVTKDTSEPMKPAPPESSTGGPLGNLESTASPSAPSSENSSESSAPSSSPSSNPGSSGAGSSKPGSKPESSVPPPSSSEPEDNKDERPDLYCPKCGNWADKCNSTCGGTKDLYCPKCGRLMSVCKDKCDGSMDATKHYCTRCGRLESVCKSSCDLSKPAVYCAQCGRLESTCCGTCQFTGRYDEQPDIWYCTRCGKPEAICLNTCDPNAPESHCEYCGKLLSEHGPDCPGYDEDTAQGGGPMEPPEQEKGYCNRCGKLNKDCQHSCDTTRPDKYCEECGRLRTEHTKKCKGWQEGDDSPAPPVNPPDTSSGSASRPNTSSSASSSSSSESSVTEGYPVKVIPSEEKT